MKLNIINRDQKERNEPESRSITYNERLLENGLSPPYFIWPNISPFYDTQNIMNAVKEARENNLGIFAPENPLILEPFELRYLSDRKSPPRYFIDLSVESDQILPKEEYCNVNPEEYLPLFELKGWRRENSLLSSNS